MSLAPGTKLGPYEILDAIGAGGMGEVYRARDTRLGRDVAVKVLPEHLSAQPEIRARFEREAKTVSSLNHPNICTLFDVGREGEIDYLVMELVDGDTLSARLGRGAMNAAELLRIGAQIADALDRAHRAGVIHRDLKPGNVMLTRSGAKLMDFGLARATGLASPGAPGSGVSVATMTHSPTVGKALTAEGTLLGTFQYMSPEQLEGAEADARSDIWALGCVLYEMATGRRPFEGRSQASLIAAILEREPAPIAEIPSGSASAAISGAMPQGLDRLIRNCLAKDPEERIQTAHDVKLQLRGIAETAGISASSSSFAPVTPLPGSAAAVAAGKHRRGSPLPWAIAAASAVIAVALGAWTAFHPAAPPPVYRFRPHVTVPGAQESFWPRLSPDGRILAFTATDSAGVSHAWVRRMDEVMPRPVVGADDFGRFYWSPDSKELVFIVQGRMVRVPVGGGAPVVICDAQGGADLSWGSKGKILMDGRRGDSLRVVPAGGGELQPATRIDRAGGETGHAWPFFLPDGEHFLYVANTGQTNEGRIRLGKLGSLEAKTLTTTDGRVEYTGGWIVFPRGTTLMAQKLDLGAGKVEGQPIPIAEGLRTGNALGHFSVSSNGLIAYAQLPNDPVNSVLIVDRRGTPIGPAIATGNFRNPRFSPDARRIFVERREAFGFQTGDVSVLDIARGTETRLTFSNGRANGARWSPDGKRFIWSTYGAPGATVLHVGASDGLGAQDSVALPGLLNAYPTQWDAAGSRWIFHSTGPAIGARIFSVSADGPDRALHAMGDSTMLGAWGRVSPDGRWLAFSSGRTGAQDIQVYVQSLIGPPGRWQISTTGGAAATWTKGGRELLFETFDQRLMAVDIDTKDGFHPGTPHALFSLQARILSNGTSAWDVDATGEKFVVIVPPRVETTNSIEVVTDFSSLVNRK
jgi:Tol biopolymer transport system component